MKFNHRSFIQVAMITAILLGGSIPSAFAQVVYYQPIVHLEERPTQGVTAPYYDIARNPQTGELSSRATSIILQLPAERQEILDTKTGVTTTSVLARKVLGTLKIQDQAVNLNGFSTYTTGTNAVVAENPVNQELEIHVLRDLGGLVQISNSFSINSKKIAAGDLENFKADLKNAPKDRLFQVESDGTIKNRETGKILMKPTGEAALSMQGRSIIRNFGTPQEYNSSQAVSKAEAVDQIFQLPAGSILQITTPQGTSKTIFINGSELNSAPTTQPS